MSDSYDFHSQLADRIQSRAVQIFLQGEYEVDREVDRQVDPNLLQNDVRHVVEQVGSQGGSSLGGEFIQPSQELDNKQENRFLKMLGSLYM